MKTRKQTGNPMGKAARGRMPERGHERGGFGPELNETPTPAPGLKTGAGERAGKRPAGPKPKAARAAGKAKPGTATGRIGINFDDAGRIGLSEVCPRCEGSGYDGERNFKEGEAPVPCRICEGFGRVTPWVAAAYSVVGAGIVRTVEHYENLKPLPEKKEWATVDTVSYELNLGDDGFIAVSYHITADGRPHGIWADADRCTMELNDLSPRQAEAMAECLKAAARDAETAERNLETGGGNHPRKRESGPATGKTAPETTQWAPEPEDCNCEDLYDTEITYEEYALIVARRRALADPYEIFHALHWELEVLAGKLPEHDPHARALARYLAARVNSFLAARELEQIERTAR